MQEDLEQGRRVDLVGGRGRGRAGHGFFFFVVLLVLLSWRSQSFSEKKLEEVCRGKTMASLSFPRSVRFPLAAREGPGSRATGERPFAAATAPKRRCPQRAGPLRRSHRVETSAFPFFLADAAATASSFEPRLSPAIAAAASLAALPPIIYWFRVAGSVKKRLDEEDRVKKEEEAKEQKRLERLRRLKGER